VAVDKIVALTSQTPTVAVQLVWPTPEDEQSATASIGSWMRQPQSYGNRARRMLSSASRFLLTRN
jgi:hypothetical protein